MDIDRMTVPLGYRNGGETQVAMSDPDPMAELEDMYNNMIKDGTKKPHRMMRLSWEKSGIILEYAR